MTLRGDSTYRCDRCGADVGNGGVHLAAIVSDLDPADPTRIRQLHFCRDHDVDTKTVKGCASRVFTAKALANYIETRKP